ncbi:hypothetical protein COCON_G00099310 [Conger conger]|uniref:Uncharacterized protein n=1 Tax=Conger conger TaxID=82655 RepID=A0A9Q1DMN0_CONCO|nr:hypothetical protein COCON_G00099310 [Conger conger]
METLNIAEREIGATLPSIEECKMTSMSCPPSQRVVDSTKWSNTNSQSESKSECLNPAYSGEDLKAESVMDSSDYKGGVEPRLSLNRCKEEGTTGYFMSREQEDVLANMKEEEEDGERLSIKMETVNHVKGEEELWKEEEEKEGHLRYPFAQTDKMVKSEVKSEHGQQEVEAIRERHLHGDSMSSHQTNHRDRRVIFIFHQRMGPVQKPPLFLLSSPSGTKTQEKQFPPLLRHSPPQHSPTQELQGPTHAPSVGRVLVSCVI